MERPGADSEEKHEPASDIDIALMDSLKVLDPEGPIREADIGRLPQHVRKPSQKQSSIGFQSPQFSRRQRSQHLIGFRAWAKSR
jgi:hypothetical protein